MVAYLWPLAVGGCQRPYSIRTRIKTLKRLIKNHYSYVRDHIPLEQGLRLAHKSDKSCDVVVRDHIPLEQGLRHHSFGLRDERFAGQRPYSIRTRIKTR